MMDVTRFEQNIMIFFIVGCLNLPISILRLLDTMIIRQPSILGVIVILTGLALIVSSTTVTPAFAIKRFFNCMTDVANKHGKLDVADVNNCYDKEYHTGPYATHGPSNSGTVGSTSVHTGTAGSK
jgi:hypothetical protein